MIPLYDIIMLRLCYNTNCIILIMLRITKNIALFSLRLKGPASQRALAKEGVVYEKMPEDHFADYYNDTIEMYFNDDSLGIRTILPHNNCKMRVKV